jgi:hypothetical protein
LGASVLGASDTVVWTAAALASAWEVRGCKAAVPLGTVGTGTVALTVVLDVFVAFGVLIAATGIAGGGHYATSNGHYFNSEP